MLLAADTHTAIDIAPDDPSVQFEVITDWPALYALRNEWNALWLRGDRPFVLQSFAVAEIVHRIPLQQSSGRLWCLIGRARGELVFVWPFLVYLNHGLRLATPIASDHDCSDPLVAVGFTSREFLRKAWARLLRECPCDIFQFRFVRENTPLQDLILQVSSRIPIYELELPLVEFSGDWASYERQLSRKQHSALARKRRRLMELGEISFEELPYDTPGLAAWIVEHKQRWLARNDLPDKIRLTHPMFVDFLGALFSGLGPERRCLIFAIRRGRRLIAADVHFVDQHALQWKIGTFDAEFARYSPGLLLKEMALRWALDHDRIFDMLAGGGQHKVYLATKVERATTWRVGRTVCGHCYIGIRRLLWGAGALSAR